MPQDSLDRIREALTRLPTCNRAELTAEWLRLYRTKPPAQIGRNLLMASVAYRLQEQILADCNPSCGASCAPSPSGHATAMNRRWRLPASNRVPSCCGTGKGTPTRFW